MYQYVRVAGRARNCQRVQTFRRHGFRLGNIVFAVNVIRWSIFFHSAILARFRRFRPRTFLRRARFFIQAGRRELAILRVGHVTFAVFLLNCNVVHAIVRSSAILRCFRCQHAFVANDYFRRFREKTTVCYHAANGRATTDSRARVYQAREVFRHAMKEEFACGPAN